MDLNDLILDNSQNWSIVKNNALRFHGDFLMYKKYYNIPVCYIDNEIVYVFLDNKIHNIIFKLTKHLVKLGVEFYFTSPILSNPKGVNDPNNEVIKHYLYSYSQKEFFNGFKKIEFDLIRNMVKWSDKEDCYNLVKPNFESILKVVPASHYDFYSNKSLYNYPDEIRE